MEQLRAHELFAARGDNRSVLPATVRFYGEDAWPAAATAAVALAGCLDDAVTDEDLDAGVAHFLTLADTGIVTEDDWYEAIEGVLAALIEWGEMQGIAY